MQKILISVLILPFITACSDWSMPSIPDGIPEVVHKITIQQGNIVNQAMINKLRPGMEKRQVRFIMGSPMINDTFHENRWDYVYRIHRSTHDVTENTRVSLFFEGNKLARIQGDMRPLPVKEEVKKKTEVVEVPYRERNVGIFDKVLGTVGLELEDEPVSGSSGNAGQGGHPH